VSTESRLLTFFELLKQMAELQRKRDKIAAEMARVAAGEVILLKDTALEDRFQQFNRGVSCSKIFSESTAIADFWPGQELSCLLGFSAFQLPPGGADCAA
jgi:hypothetical protein